MKKSLLMATLVGVALTGCVNEEVVTNSDVQKELLFTAPALKTQTRANILGEIAGTTAYIGENFNVSAWTYQGSYSTVGSWSSSDNNGPLTNFFAKDGEEAIHGQTYWATATTHYWPAANFNLMFAAYSPSKLNVIMKKNAEGQLEQVQGTDEKPIVDCKPAITYDETGVTIANFKVQSVADYQYDLMYSDYAVDRNVTNNAGVPVALQFNHALSSIVFSAAKSQADITYEILSAELIGNFITEGTFKQNIGTAPAWTPEAAAVACSYKPTFSPYDVKEAPGQFTSGTSALLLIPQTVPEEAVVRLTYQKKSSTSTLKNTVDLKLRDFLVTKDDNGISKTYAIEEWKPGTRYIYCVSFGANKPIYFQPTLSPWVEETNAVYTINY